MKSVYNTDFMFVNVCPNVVPYVCHTGHDPKLETKAKSTMRCTDVDPVIWKCHCRQAYLYYDIITFFTCGLSSETESLGCKSHKRHTKTIRNPFNYLVLFCDLLTKYGFASYEMACDLSKTLITDLHLSFGADSLFSKARSS